MLRHIVNKCWLVNYPRNCERSIEDPSQNLRILMDRDSKGRTRLIPLQLSTRELHPRASVVVSAGLSNISEVKLWNDKLVFDAYDPSVLKDNAPLGTKNIPFQFKVWNWATQSLTTVSPPSLLENDFLLIGAEHLVVLEEAAEPTTLNLFVCTNEVPCVFALIAEFELPPLKYSFVSLQDEFDQQVPCSRMPPCDGHFYNEPDATLVRVHMHDDDDDEDTWFEMLVPAQALLSLACSGPSRRFSWESWGPDNAHIFHYPDIKLSYYGCRALPYAHPILRNGEWKLQVNDYHPARIAAAESAYSSDDEDDPEIDWVVCYGETIYGKYTTDGEALVIYAPYIASYQCVPDSVLGDDPGRVRFEIGEDCILMHNGGFLNRKDEEHGDFDMIICAF
ncbi:hypothetical protein K488DRAFT_85618 [Vararia minispora EC-137]|uniref:Uncharacterized protein n=1 Tax=Vararia minispora EC-137 TaxID=1314806 RepID=A0ACB8QM28_9AGAM|nr:hypothetical protein K488DRAFT_85618 [Vararia minispora EC-137]